MVAMLQRRYAGTNPHFLWNREFISTVKECQKHIVNSRDNLYVHLAQFNKTLKVNLLNYERMEFRLCYPWLLLLLLLLFNGLFSWTTWVSRHQKGKPFWILLEQEMMGWQWHQLDHMQIICISLQTDNHASTSPLSFYRPDALPAAQPTASKH